MAHVVLQKGHCFRRSGATGTSGEQVMAHSVVNNAAMRLQAHGHQVTVVLADDRKLPSADVFAAVHMDGSIYPSARGASVGYRNDASRIAAKRWKVNYQLHGFPGGFRRDNYTPGLAKYYGTWDAGHAGIPAAFIMEVGFGTNPYDRAWIDRNHDRIAQSIVDMVGDLHGHPRTPLSTLEDEMNVVCTRPDGNRWQLTGGVRIHLNTNEKWDAALKTGAKDIGTVPTEYVNSFPWPAVGWRPGP